LSLDDDDDDDDDSSSIAVSIGFVSVFFVEVFSWSIFINESMFVILTGVGVLSTLAQEKISF